MNKLEKPKFFTTPIWANISIVLGIIALFSFTKQISDVIILISIISLILVFILWNFIKYIISWHKLYKAYLEFFSKFNELDTRYNTRITELKDKDLLINKYEDFINKLNSFILGCLQRNSAKETQQFQNLQQFLYQSSEHIINLKGGKSNG